MNTFLAEMYGTRETVGADTNADDVEKLAEAKILTEFFQAENIDIANVPDAAILKVAAEIFPGGSALVKEAMHDGKHDGMPEAFKKGKDKDKDDKDDKYDKKYKEDMKEKGEESEEEKVAQADMLGRIMAHSMHQEMKLIKQAEAAPAATLEKPAEKTAGKLAQHLATLRGETAPTQEKVAQEQPSATDILARHRAHELLKEAGYDVDGEKPTENTEEQKLAAVVEQRALEILKASGYPVQ